MDRNYEQPYCRNKGKANKKRPFKHYMKQSHRINDRFSNNTVTKQQKMIRCSNKCELPKIRNYDRYAKITEYSFDGMSNHCVDSYDLDLAVLCSNCDVFWSDHNNDCCPYYLTFDHTANISCV